MKTTHSDTIALLSNQRNYRGATDYALKEVTDLDERVALLTKILIKVQEHGSMDDSIYVHDHLEEQTALAADDHEARVKEWDDVPTVDLRPAPRATVETDPDDEVTVVRTILQPAGAS